VLVERRAVVLVVAVLVGLTEPPQPPTAIDARMIKIHASREGIAGNIAARGRSRAGTDGSANAANITSAQSPGHAFHAVHGDVPAGLTGPAGARAVPPPLWLNPETRGGAARLMDRQSSFTRFSDN
jgi:hypothetical protein